ncbi:hypothetical protein AAHA92_00575 [Salvia divinorum]|uniref:Uncharacterized protein n=1 Tax=Salvia divinorum TaxID=28513 RepID=A0ABD1IK03_SALDI
MNLREYCINISHPAPPLPAPGAACSSTASRQPPLLHQPTTPAAVPVPAATRRRLAVTRRCFERSGQGRRNESNVAARAPGSHRNAAEQPSNVGQKLRGTLLRELEFSRNGSTSFLKKP